MGKRYYPKVVEVGRSIKIKICVVDKKQDKYFLTEKECMEFIRVINTEFNKEFEYFTKTILEKFIDDKFIEKNNKKRCGNCLYCDIDRNGSSHWCSANLKYMHCLSCSCEKFSNKNITFELSTF